MRATGAAAAAGAIAFSLATAATAQPTPDEQAVADLRFREGRDLLAAKKVDLACAKFAESARLYPRAGVLLNLASCHEAQGKVASAWTEYDLAHAAARKEGRADREKLAQDQMAALKDELSWLTIEVPEGADAALEVRRDGAPVGRGAFGVAIPVDPGEHVVTFEAPGTPKQELRVTVAPHGDHRSVSIPVRMPARNPRILPPEAPTPYAGLPYKPAPLVAGPGVPFLHIEGNRPDIVLFSVPAPDPNLPLAIPTLREICVAPCDQLVDGRGESRLYFAGHGVPSTEVFSFEGRQGPVTAKIKAGNLVPAQLGLAGMVIGGIGGFVGVITTLVGVGGGDTRSGIGTRNVGLVMLGSGALSFATGTILYFANRTTYTLEPP